MSNSLSQCGTDHRADSGWWAGRRVALTGATGFVGHHLALRLAASGARVTALVRSTSRRQPLVEAGITCIEAPLEDTAALAEGCRGCDVVFHVAGAVDFEDNWDSLQRINVGGTRNVLTAARTAGVRRVVHTSSIVAVGGSRLPCPVDETTTWNLERYRVAYVTTKRQAEQAALTEAGRDLEVVVVNPASVIGPGDFSKSEFGTLCQRFWRRRMPIHFGGGNNFVDVRDVAEGHLLAAERGRCGERYLLGGTDHTWTGFFAELARVAPRPIFRVRLPGMLAGLIAALEGVLRRKKTSRPYLTPGQARLLPLFFYFDSGKASRDLGYAPRPLGQTIQDAYRFWMTKL